MMGDLITVYVKSPSIPAQGVLGDYIDRCIIALQYTWHVCICMSLCARVCVCVHRYMYVCERSMRVTQ